jgi:nucleolar pre-ribosomal-associated protein 1
LGQNFDILALSLSILSTVLTLLSSHPDGHGSAAPLIKVLFAPHLQRRLRGYLDGSQNDLILGSLKLYLSLANFAGGSEQKEVLENFPWTIKSLPKLLFMRRKSKGTENVDPLARPGKV